MFWRDCTCLRDAVIAYSPISSTFWVGVIHTLDLRRLLFRNHWRAYTSILTFFQFYRIKWIVKSLQGMRNFAETSSLSGSNKPLSEHEANFTQFVEQIFLKHKNEIFSSILLQYKQCKNCTFVIYNTKLHVKCLL